MNIETISRCAAKKRIHDFLTTRDCAAISGFSKDLCSILWPTMATLLKNDATRYYLVVALDAYRQQMLTEMREAHLADTDESVRRGIRITTSHQIDLAYIHHAGSGHLSDLRATFEKCIGILVFLLEEDLGSPGLAYWEWVQACEIGHAPTVYYIVPGSKTSERMKMWLSKHGVKCLHVISASDEKAPSKATSDSDPISSPAAPPDEITHPIKLVYAPMSKYRSISSHAIFSHHQICHLNQAAEIIHRRGGTTHAYFFAGDTRGKYDPAETALCCHPEVENLPVSSCHKHYAISPASQIDFYASLHAIQADEHHILCHTPESLLAAYAMLTHSEPNDDLDAFAPGHLSRALIGTYMLYTRLYFGLPLPTALTPELGHFVPPLINALLCYWRSAGITAPMPSGCQGLTTETMALLSNADDLLKCGGQWLHSNNIFCLLPNDTPLGFANELLTRWTQNGTLTFGDAFFRMALPERSSMGTNILITNDTPVIDTWLDATDAILSFDEAHAIRAALLNGSPRPDIVTDAKASSCLNGLCETCADIVSSTEYVAEYCGNSIKWWTFGGAMLNAVLATLLLGEQDVLYAAFGNCAIQVTLKNDANTEKCASAILKKTLAYATTADDNDADRFARLWFWPLSSQRWLHLLGAKWQRGYIRHVISKLAQKMVSINPTLFVKTDALHTLMETTMSIQPPPASMLHSASPNVYPLSEAIGSVTNRDSLDNTDAGNNTPAADTHDKIDACSASHDFYYYKLERGDGSQMHTRLPWFIIRNEADLGDAIEHILREPFIGLDVETTLFDHKLCLVQIGCHDRTFLIDPFCVDVRALDIVFANPNIVKIIHNKSFECNVLGKLGLPIYNIVDTLKVSRTLHPTEKCHKLMEVCRREFNYTMDKTNQQSRWEKRPLSTDQLEYAALDAEIMIHLYCHFFGTPK